MRKTLLLTGFGFSSTLALLIGAAPAGAAGSVMDHDGTYQVNADITPGYYTTHAADGPCTWARLSATGAVLSSGQGGNPTLTVRIPATDARFTTSGCGVWSIEGGQPNLPGTGSAGN
ncbi:hypothetical protein [Nocardia sp. NPDC020380]|uniref:hypothetical protein n=1 Tax=Nocardia sp. NPDC020380 TaxID=3364309 RepID=UPI0037B17503